MIDLKLIINLTDQYKIFQHDLTSLVYFLKNFQEIIHPKIILSKI